jgi:hypothetical protein
MELYKVKTGVMYVRSLHFSTGLVIYVTDILIQESHKQFTLSIGHKFIRNGTQNLIAKFTKT